MYVDGFSFDLASTLARGMFLGDDQLRDVTETGRPIHDESVLRLALAFRASVLLPSCREVHMAQDNPKQSTEDRDRQNRGTGQGNNPHRSAISDQGKGQQNHPQRQRDQNDEVDDEQMDEVEEDRDDEDTMNKGGRRSGTGS